jgi:K+-transporting ATPase KdpF subunit
MQDKSSFPMSFFRLAYASVSILYAIFTRYRLLSHENLLQLPNAFWLRQFTISRRLWHSLGNRLNLQGDKHGFLLSWTDAGVLRAERGACLCLGKTEEAAMSWLYMLCGVLALAIFVYLIIALLFPEKF